MPSLFATLILWFLLAPSASVLAKGGVDGAGGGNAIYCEGVDELVESKVDDDPSLWDGVKQLSFNSGRRQYDKSLPTTNGRHHQFLDLWEASTGYGPFAKAVVGGDGTRTLARTKIAIRYSTESIDLQIERALGRLTNVAPHFAPLVDRALRHVRKREINAPAGDYVLPVHDTRVRVLPIGCRLLGLGSYSIDDDDLVVDQEVKKKLTDTDLAAFYLHEAIYWVLRELNPGLNNSWSTRRIVGYLFSSAPDLQHALLFPPSEGLRTQEVKAKKKQQSR